MQLHPPPAQEPVQTAPDTVAKPVAAAAAAAAAAVVGAGPASTNPFPPTPATGWLLETLAVVLQASPAHYGVARALVAHVAATARCQRVALAWVDGTASPAVNAELTVLAVSDLPPLREARTTSADTLRDLQSAMQECAAAGSTLCLPMNEATARHPLLAHVQMARACGSAAVCSLPLGDTSPGKNGLGQVRGVLTLQRDAAQPFTPQELRRLEQLALFLAPVLRLRGVARHSTLDTPTDAPRWWQALRQRWQQAAPLWLLAGVVLVGAVPLDHAVVSPARVHGLSERHLTAPRDGFIAAVQARPGDTVAAGQTLVSLDEEGPRNDLKAAQATMEQAESAFGEALARGEQSQVVTQVAKLDEARARVAVLQDELARGQVQAPAAGSVVQGDLTRSIGAPVKRGDTLLVVAAAQGSRLSLWVDERDMHQVQVGQSGSLRLATQPGVVHSLQVQRITPVASVREGHNGFEVDAQLLSPASGLPATGANAALLKPGFEGIARLDAGQAPLAWVLGHRVWQWLQLGWWSWLG
jgi:biotin carboxyl carrier protein